MTKLLMTAAVLGLMSLQPVLARGGGSHSAMHGLTAPADPTVPPSLTPDPRLTGSAPVPQHDQPTTVGAASQQDTLLRPTPEDSKVDRIINNICRGC